MGALRYIQNVVVIEIDAEACTGCTMCESVCPHRVIAMQDRRARIVDRDACIECGACARNCPASAIRVTPGVGCAAAIIHGWLTGSEPRCGGPDGCC